MTLLSGDPCFKTWVLHTPALYGRRRLLWLLVWMVLVEWFYIIYRLEFHPGHFHLSKSGILFVVCLFILVFVPPRLDCVLSCVEQRRTDPVNCVTNSLLRKFHIICFHRYSWAWSQLQQLLLNAVSFVAALTQFPHPQPNESYLSVPSTTEPQLWAHLICSRLTSCAFFPPQGSQHSKVHLHPWTRTHPAAGLQGGGDGRARAGRRGLTGPSRQAATLHHQLRCEQADVAMKGTVSVVVLDLDESRLHTLCSQQFQGCSRPVQRGRRDKKHNPCHDHSFYHEA